MELGEIIGATSNTLHLQDRFAVRHVLIIGDNFHVFRPVVVPNAVLVIDLETVTDPADKCLPDEAMGLSMKVSLVDEQGVSNIAAMKSLSQNA